jgi:hypothetical protein
VIFYGLLYKDLRAQQMGEGCQETAKPVLRLTRGDGYQDEKLGEGFHAHGLNPSRGMA